MRSVVLVAFGVLASSVAGCGADSEQAPGGQTSPSTGGTGGSGGQGGASAGGSTATGGQGGSACLPDELCDGIDNDCDDEVDEGCDCVENQTQSCYTGDPDLLGHGACAEGVETCDIHGDWGDCEGEVTPSEEVCNGLDDDCNDETDEDLGTVTCGLGICQVTVNACEAGQPVPCVPGDPNPAGETCEGSDDDCDGDVDEDCPCLQNETQPCYNGSPTTQGIGECHDGLQTCDAGGTFGACLGDQTPVPELCNNLDDDCDGVPDDGNPEGGAVCATGMPGVCAVGTTQCVNGSLDCEPDTQPAPVELCDGIDANCNGLDDFSDGCQCLENDMQACYSGPPLTQNIGECSDGLQTCDISGQWGNCIGEVLPQAESCDNDDDDCNGVIDNGLSFPCYTGAAQTEGVGECHGGNQVCSFGVWGACQGEVTPVIPDNLCDGLDSDCDGDDDYAEGCPCVLGDSNPCYEGAPGTLNVGECHGGTESCDINGNWGSCQGQQLPVTEQCNDSLDSDCDGNNDNGCCDPVILSTDFEGGAAGFDHNPLSSTPGDDPWELGTPNHGGGCHSGTQCWATDLNDDYDDCETAELVSPAMDLSLCGTSTVEVTFWHWYRFEEYSSGRWWDGGNIQFSPDDGANWYDTTPSPGYQGVIDGAYGSCTPDPEIGGHSAWSGDISPLQWTKVTVTVAPAYKTSQFRFRYLFGADENTTDWGWLIDDIEVISY